MKPRMVSHLSLLLIALLTAPAIASAQEATLTGTIADSTGGVLPGVTVTAVHEATGNRFVAVTDERGIYRIPARVGVYQITAELPGFTTVTQSGRPAAGRPDRRDRPADAAVDDPGNRHGVGGGPLLNVSTLEPRRQHRSASRSRNCPCRVATGWPWPCSRPAAA